MTTDLLWHALSPTGFLLCALGSIAFLVWRWRAMRGEG
jgi:hypothetical protein